MAKEIKGELVPFYVVGDVSGSMTRVGKSGESGIDALNEIVPRMVEAFKANPRLGDMVRFGMLSFSDSAKEEVPLADIRDIAKSTLPVLTPGGGTSYMVAFLTLREVLARDTEQLKADGYRVHRPVVFFFSDGMPTDYDQEWKDAWAKLTEDTEDYHAYPILLPFGVGEAMKETLDYIAFPKDGKYEVVRARLGMREKDTAEVTTSLMNAVVGSTVATARFLAEGDYGAVVKGLKEGLAEFEEDEDDGEDDWI